MSDRLPGRRRVRVSVGPSESITVEAHRPHRLVLGSPAGPGDAGDRDRRVGGEAPQRTLGHRLSHRLGHRPVRLDERSVDVEHARLGLVGVGDHPARDVCGRTRHVGEPRRDESRGAGLRRRDATARQQRCDLIVDPGAVLRKDLAGMAFAQTPISSAYTGAASGS